MSAITRILLQGAIAGAAGTVALNAATYADMALRGRPASKTPSEVVEKLADSAGTSIPGNDDERANRAGGLGALMGISAGVTTGLALSVGRALGWPTRRTSTALAAWGLAMVAGNGPMTALGVTDPRRWTKKEWVADVVPHAAYALATTTALRALGSRHA